MTNKKFICLLMAVCLCAGLMPMMLLRMSIVAEGASSGGSYSNCDSSDPDHVHKVTFMNMPEGESNNTILGTGAVNSMGYLAIGGMPMPPKPASLPLAPENYITKWYTDQDEYIYHGMSISECKTAYPVWTEKPGYTTDISSAIPNGMSLEGPYIYDEDEDVMMTPAEAGYIHEYGDAAYYLLIDETSDKTGPMSAFDHVEKLKVKAKGWTNGGDIVEGVSVVKRKVDVDVLFNNGEGIKHYNCADVLLRNNCESGYYYFLEIKIGEKESTSETDVIGVVEFDRKADSKKGIGKIDESSHDIEFSAFYEYSWITKTPTITEDTVDLEWGNTYALKFDYDEEVELSFGNPNGGNNEGTFEVDISGQGKVLLRYSTDPVEAVSAANEGADIDYLIFNNVKFNRTGTFTYEMENGAHAYRIIDGKLVEIENCYDESEEAFIFHTNRLEAYVFADRELVNPA